MASIVMGHRDGAPAIALARDALATLTSEWPDVRIVPRTLPRPATGVGTADDPLLRALLDGKASLALLELDDLPPSLPEGLALAAVPRRPDARSALVARRASALDDLPDGASVAVARERDREVLAALRPGLALRAFPAGANGHLALAAAGDADALLLPAATLRALDLRDRIAGHLDPAAFPPAPGQGALGVIVRDGDDLAGELAYTLQHRPSFDRVLAERAFLSGVLEGDADALVGAHATLEDGRLELLGVVLRGGESVRVRGSTALAGSAASGAAALGRDLAARALGG